MQKTMLNYRVIISQESYADGSLVYVANCPTLDVHDYGDTVEEVMISIKDGIELAIESLEEEHMAIPSDNIENQIIATTQIEFPRKLHIAT